VFFVFKNDALATGDILIVSEIMYDPKGTDTGQSDWIELYNPTDSPVVFGKSTFGLIDEPEIRDVATGKLNNPCHTIPDAGIAINPKEYLIVAGDKEDFLNSYPGYTGKIVDSTLELLSNGDSMKISLNRCATWIIAISYLDSWGAKSNGRTLELITLDNGYAKENWQESFVEGGTPGVENSKPEEKVLESPRVYTDNIQITELFPNPFKAQYEEYLELYNGTAERVDLAGWTLHDASKTGKYTFPVGFLIKAKEYLAIFKKDFKFALNNSGDESVTLFDPNGKEVAKASYGGSKQNLSYNFDGSLWRWSKFLTPGLENILNSEPYGTLKKAENIYVNVYADFSISTGDKDGDIIKVTWDFGDGYKSYLAKTRHKYLTTGKYLASVKLSDGSEEVLKEFVVEVKKIPHPKVSLVAVNANPKGKDSEFETLTIKNSSKKKINLKGWSIATGAKKLANHPIKESVIIKKGKAKEVTRQVSSFSLNNKKAKIELRYPDGKVASKLKYDHGKVAIAEDEIYEKTKSGWVWKKVTSNQPASSADGSLVNSNQETKDNSQESMNSEQEATDNSQNTIDNTQNTKDNEQGVERENRILGKDETMVGSLKVSPRVLGAETVREEGGQYFFTSQIEQKHYLVSFWERILTKLNAGMNQVLNYFWK